MIQSESAGDEKRRYVGRFCVFPLEDVPQHQGLVLVNLETNPVCPSETLHRKSIQKKHCLLLQYKNLQTLKVSSASVSYYFKSKVTEEFTKTHVEHGMDLGQMKITREKNGDIARKLKNKIPVEAILDEIRNSMKK
ncbi:hypothetical protein TNIN_451491 [Trichonephila inaurata madagascariensis]|uniref:Uncharacterized protein n=1 Tax=Trichonephila inaurata madagascariensis TaxID=2747483 RepID=A0A8X6I7J2_9ARAC|nr:hypothetical protein TNIN_451491 [Trichonephila inaurata madagascariensis]